MGVITVADIDYGEIFGPFPSHLTAADPAYVIGMLTSDKQADGTILRINVEDLRAGPSSLDWLPYVSTARDEAEQNMEAYVKEGGVFYRTLRIVRAEEELLVWYSKDLSHLLGLPEIRSNSKTDDEQFICSHCGEMFDYPFPLRAHLKFKCAYAADIKGYRPGQSLLTIKTDTLDMLDPGERSLISQSADKTNNNKSIYNKNKSGEATLPVKRHLESNPHDPPSPIKVRCLQGNRKPVRNGNGLKYSIEELCKSSVAPEKLEEDGHHLKENGPTKPADSVYSAFRKVERKRSHSSERLTTTSLGSSTVGASPQDCTPEDLSMSPCSADRSPSPQLASPNSPTGSLQPAPIHGSAIPPSRNILPLSASTSMPPPPRPPFKPAPSSSTSPSSMFHPEDALFPRGSTSVMSLYLPRIPIFPPTPPTMLGIPRHVMLSSAGSSSSPKTSSSTLPPMPTSSTKGHPLLPPQAPPIPSSFPVAPADQIPPGLLEMCRSAIPTVGPLTESLAANIRNGEALSKQALFADRHISSLGFLKSNNPMVEKLLQSTNPTLLTSPVNALNLSQNWCAKCNATFRMTSDLVYHMRSHHKREFDPMKRKREEKLKCNICNEAFRERHHLTRHMSSHA